MPAVLPLAIASSVALPVYTPNFAYENTSCHAIVDVQVLLS